MVIPDPRFQHYRKAKESFDYLVLSGFMKGREMRRISKRIKYYFSPLFVLEKKESK